MPALAFPEIMKNLLILVITLLAASAAFGQTCAAADAQTQWQIRNEAKVGEWANGLRPVHQEMQRVFPKPPAGLEVTHGIFDAMGKQTAPAGITQYYEGFYMIKDMVCEGGKVVPQGATGAWIYFRVNDFGYYMGNGGSNLKFLNGGVETPIVLARDIKLVESRNGLTGIYLFNEKNQQELTGWLVTSIRKPPFRRLSRAELGASMRAFWTKKFDEDIARLERSIAQSKVSGDRVRNDSSMSAKDKDSYFKSLAESDRQSQLAIDRLQSQRAQMTKLTDGMMRGPDANADAFIRGLADYDFNPANYAATGDGLHAYIEDRTVYDPRLPKSQPQMIVASFRRDGQSAAKLAMIRKFEKEFDFNAVRRAVSASPLQAAITIEDIGSTPGDSLTGPIASTEKLPAGTLFEDEFDRTPEGKAPANWTLSQSSAIVRNDGEGKRLTLREAGLYYPDWATVALPQKFTIEFDVSWPKEISYYSQDFVFHLGAANYDNAVKLYDRAQVAPNSYTSARMPRLMLWIDPHWNNENGRWGIDLFDARGGYAYRKSDKTQIWFKDKNSIKVKITRNGAALGIYFNDKLVVSEPGIMTETVRWNFFGFGLTEAPNALKGDQFYLGNIKVSN